MSQKFIALIVVLLSISACGTTRTERGVSGAGLGAATGAAVGAVTGLTVAQGALIGAAGGAIAGLATDSRQVNLGKPLWKQGDGRDGSAPAPYVAHAGTADRATVRDIQRGLRDHGFDPGPVDGMPGPRTQQAIRDYQRRYDLLVDGRATPQLAEHIRSH